MLAPEVARAFLISTTSLSSELEDLSLREWWLIYGDFGGGAETTVRRECRDSGIEVRRSLIMPLGYSGKRVSRPAVEAGNG